MAGEQDIGKGNDQVRFDRTDRTGETLGQDSDLGKEKHQELHRDFKQTENQNTFSDPALITPLPGESLEAYERRVEEIQLNRFGFDGELTPEDMGGKTIASSRHGLTVNPSETAQEVVTTAQTPPVGIGDSSKLLASNIAPNVPKSDQMQVATDATPEAITAWDPRQAYQDVRQHGLRTDIVRATDISAATHPFRGREASEVNKIPAARWDEAYSLFSELAEAGITNGSVTEVSKAIVRNELHHYDMWDRADDTAARVAGHPLPLRKNEGDATLGYSQLSPNSITKRCAEFPQLREYLTEHGYPPGAELKALADPEMVPVLVAANLAHNAKMYARHGIPVNERTLAYGFNPDERDSKGAKILLPDESTLNKSQHVANVMLQIELLRKGE